jgi:hypothetical protein
MNTMSPALQADSSQPTKGTLREIIVWSARTRGRPAHGYASSGIRLQSTLSFDTKEGAGLENGSSLLIQHFGDDANRESPNQHWPEVEGQ